MNKYKVLIFMILLQVQFAHAGIVIAGTRFIYPSSENFVSVDIENTGSQTLLVQAWVDTENEVTDLSQSKAPFVVSPPLKALNAKMGQSLRIIFNKKQKLSEDRETLFWLNVLEIPPKPEHLDSYIQFAVKSKLKLIYRPSSLKEPKEDTFNKINVKAQDGSVIFENPTPYYINFGKKKLFLKDGRSDDLVGVRYLEPFETKIIKPINNGVFDKVEMYVINDFGTAYQISKSF